MSAPQPGQVKFFTHILRTDRQTDRQTDDRQTDRQTDKQNDS